MLLTNKLVKYFTNDEIHVGKQLYFFTLIGTYYDLQGLLESTIAELGGNLHGGQRESCK